MNVNNDRIDKFLLSFADIFTLFRQYQFQILSWSFLFCFLAMFFSLMKPIRYQAEATFREKAIKPSNFSTSTVIQFLSGQSEGESEAASLMISNKILKNVIEELNLQAKLEQLSEIENIPRLLKRNFLLSWWQMFSRSPQPVLEDLYCPLKCKQFQYTGEIPSTFLIDLKSDGSYEVLDVLHGKKSVGWGKLGEPFEFEKLSFNLLHDPKEIIPQKFSLSANSFQNTAKELRSFLKVETSKFDKNLLSLKFEHRNRFLSSAVLNGIMVSYQSYLKNHQSNMANNQLDYLKQRKDQLTKSLILLMEKHADYLANDLYNSGFIESEKEMEFLASNQNDYKKQLLDNELEINRLTNIKPGNLAYYDRHILNDGNASVINSILTEMRNLKHSRDSLEIELQKKSMDHGVNLQYSFEEQLDELKEIQDYLSEVKDIAREYEKGILLELSSKLINDSRFLLKGWFERLKKLKQDHGESWKDASENFKFYLNNLERLLSVHERILQERLTHHQKPSDEYQGISYELATNLYLDYSKQLIQMEATIRQNLFFIKQIEDPDFEITSLSSGLDDSVSLGMIKKASDLILNLRDQNNQSMREQERIKEELQLQRTFLTLHLKQMVQLMELNKQLINEKIFALQNVSLELIHQRISLLEKNLQDYLISRLFDLQIEKTLIKGHLDGIYGKMALLPQKWVSEKIISQEVQLNQKIVEEIVTLVESKNISNNLEVIQSAPIDFAIPPVHPSVPKLALWGILGFLLGGFLSSGFIFGKTIHKGLKVSVENLNLMGFHVSGVLDSPLLSPTNKHLQKRNFDTLRRLQTFFNNPSDSPSIVEANVLLILEGNGPYYTSNLVELLLKKGKRILTIDLNSEETDSNGLVSYLNGEISEISIQKESSGDRMILGRETPYIIEWVTSNSFQELLNRLKSDYDWILIVSHVSPCSVEAESLINYFSNVVATLNNECIEELKIYERFLDRNLNNKLTFILNSL